MNFNLESAKRDNLILPEIKELSQEEKSKITDHCNVLVGLFSGLDVSSLNNNSSFEEVCRSLQSLCKEIASQNNLKKIIEADSMLVGMASQLETCRGVSSSHAKNMESFIKQADALSSIIDHCNYYKTYKDYEIVMKTHTKNVRSCEKYGLPEDSVFHNLNSNISSLKDAKKYNIGPSVYDNLTDTRINVLTRAKILYMQRQLPFMIEFSERNHDKHLALSFALNRARIESNIQTLLDKSDEVLGIQKAQEKTQTQTQQTQDLASNKTKSSPDIER